MNTSSCEETCRNYQLGEHAPGCIHSRVNRVKWIINTSIDDARQTIRNCDDIKLLTAALGKELNGSKRSTMIKMLESRIRKLEKPHV